MSISAAQSSEFYEQVVRERRVFTFLEDGSFLVHPVEGREVVPFWSSRSRLERVQRAHPKFRGYELDETALDAFLTRTLPDLAAENIHVAINWSGARLTGYDVAVAELVRNLDYWRERLAQR